MLKPDDKLDSLQHRIDEAKEHAGLETPEAGSEGATDKRAAEYATELFAGVLVGGVMGYFLDEWLHTSPVLFILFFFLGGAAGVRNMIRDVANQTDRE